MLVSLLVFQTQKKTNNSKNCKNNNKINVVLYVVVNVVKPNA